jgi:hypothetical protein
MGRFIPIPIPYVTTLKQIVDSGSTEGIYPFMRFAKLHPNGEVATWGVIPFGRFREVPNRKDVIEVRSCDCGGSICGVPTVSIHLPCALLDKYIFIEGNLTVMTFVLQP